MPMIESKTNKYVHYDLLLDLSESSAWDYPSHLAVISLFTHLPSMNAKVRVVKILFMLFSADHGIYKYE